LSRVLVLGLAGYRSVVVVVLVLVLVVVVLAVRALRRLAADKKGSGLAAYSRACVPFTTAQVRLSEAL